MLVARVLVDVVLAVAVPLTVVRLFGLDRGFPLATVMTVYPYVVVVGALAVVGAALLRARPELLIAGGTLLVGLLLVMPRALPGPEPAEAANGLHLVVAVINLREGNGDATTIVRAVDDEAIDVLVGLEVTDASVEALGRAGLDDRLPYAEVLPSRVTSGAGIWSRHPLESREASRLRGFGATPRATVEVEDHGPLEIDAVHPLPPINDEWTGAWERVLRSLPPPADGAESRRLLAGDFNATIDHRSFRELLDHGWVDAAEARGAGLRPTFSGLAAGEPVPPVTLDHVLVDTAVGVDDVTTRAVRGSDHRMLIARLRLPAG